ncbi:UNKNOWN [Stylonychia lemnae]|uniref:Uncharacterized protein n=1 Tax=Stylonychia lemnae TaxID=5949 RepID=A0A078B729_STYLE|nr:UNKNOWN [Stylonychia lemnae]|eukprot:CDW89368.1 UNKNOWN [Stylonychia lemnae]
MASALSQVSQPVGNNASALSAPANQNNQEDLQFVGRMIKPAEVGQIWNSPSPQENLIPVINKYIEFQKTQNSTFDQYDEYENWFENEEKLLLADYILQNLTFACDELQLSQNHYAVALILNAFIDVALIKETHRSDYDKFSTQTRFTLLRNFCQEQFQAKVIQRHHVKQIIDFAHNTIFKHLALFESVFNQKRKETVKSIKVTLPEQQVAGNLQTNCQEIVEERHDDENQRSQQDFYQDQDDQKNEEQEQEDEIDPDDPLYGLEQRLRHMNLDEDSRRIIKEKLEEANSKIKNALEDRQRNLDSKLGDKGGAAAGQKKK